jgi:hypothetical protein
MSETMGFLMRLGPAASAVEVTAVRRVTPPLLDTEGGFRAIWLAAPSCIEIPLVPRWEGITVFNPWADTEPLISGLALVGCGPNLKAAIVTAREPRGKRLAGRGRLPPPMPEVNIAPGACTVPAPHGPVVTRPPHCC